MDLSKEERFQIAADVGAMKELMRHPGWLAYLKWVEKKVANAKDTLVKCNAEEHDLRRGLILGLVDATTTPLAVDEYHKSLVKT